jgi:hypothetical protein
MSLTRPSSRLTEAEWRRRFPGLFLLSDRLAALEREYGISPSRVRKILGLNSPMFAGRGLFAAVSLDLRGLKERLRHYERARASLMETYPELSTGDGKVVAPPIRWEFHALDTLLRHTRAQQKRAVSLAEAAGLNPARPFGVPPEELARMTPAQLGQRPSLRRWRLIGDRVHELARYLSRKIPPQRRWRTRADQPYTDRVLQITAELVSLAYPFLPRLTPEDVKNRIRARRKV